MIKQPKAPTKLVSVVYEKGTDSLLMTRYIGKAQYEQVRVFSKDLNADFNAAVTVEDFRMNGIPA